MPKKEFDNSTSVFLFITDYSKWGGIAGPLSMAFFHFSLCFNPAVRFYKLMGCGKNGSFDIQPDLCKWAFMIFEKSSAKNHPNFHPKPGYFPGKFIETWWKIWGGKTRVFKLQPFTGHGSWDGFMYKHHLDGAPVDSGRVAVLTRATIRFSKLLRFWKFVPSAAAQLNKQAGLQFTVGIGEIPFIKQATFSIWDSIESIKNYAYQQAIHKEIVKLTKQEKWYSEEMFVRFRVLDDYLIQN
jgi:hypothetical protein